MLRTLQGLHYASVHSPDVTAPVDLQDLHTLEPVEVQHRFRELPVLGHPLGNRRRIVVSTMLLSGAPAETFYQALFIDVENQHHIDAAAGPAQEGTQVAGLRSGARIAVEDRPCGSVRRFQPHLHQTFDHCVRHQLAGSQERRHLTPKGGACGGFGTQELSRRDMGNVQFPGDQLRLRSLPTPGRPEQDAHHRGQPAAGSGPGSLSLRRVRPRRLPSCIAWTRATGIALPSSIRSALRRCGPGICSAHGSPPPINLAAVCSVNPAGATRSRSSQVSGNETGTPGRTRGLYAATTVPPPTRVESRNTLPARSSRRNAVVVSAGSRRSARAATARVAAATSSTVTGASIGTNTCRPLAPLVLTSPARPASVKTWRTTCAARTASWNAPEDGGSMSRTRWVGQSQRSARINAAWYSTARWLANHSSVRRSLHSA